VGTHLAGADLQHTKHDQTTNAHTDTSTSGKWW
jgi:hypothetical protein